MSKYVKIISDDVRFAKMLTLELADIGIGTRDLPTTDRSDENFVVADLDIVSSEELEALAASATVIGYTKNELEYNDAVRDICAAVFNRPFLMSDFLSVFGDGEAVKQYNAKAKHQENHRKPHFLSVDEKSSSALWGEQKIPLSDNEYRVLALLCENRGEIVERERIYSLLGAEDGNMGDVYICHLRRKIDNKLGIKLIYTIRGKGYMLKN